MPKSTTPVATATTTLAGKSAKELRDLLATKAVTAKAVIAHLSAKETLRAPSQGLLDELRGVKAAPAPAKAEAPKAPAPAKAEKASNAVIEGRTARVTALEAALAALAPAAKAPAAKTPVAKVAAAKAAKETVAKDAAKAAKAGKGK